MEITQRGKKALEGSINVASKGIYVLVGSVVVAGQGIKTGVSKSFKWLGKKVQSSEQIIKSASDEQLETWITQTATNPEDKDLHAILRQERALRKFSKLNK